MKIAGFILIAFGLIDFVGSYADFDLWGGFLGIELPEAVWSISAYLEFAAGYLLLKFGSNANSEPEPEG